MKKKLFLGLLAAAAVSFTACQKDEVLNEVQQDNAIGFGTYVGRDAQTKASVTDKTAMEKNTYDGFGVFAYYTGDNTYAETFTHEFMDNQQVKWDTRWDYNPKKYWPGGTNKVSFFAYAPYTDVTSSSIENITAFGYDNTDKGNPTLSFTVEDEVNKQIDLLYATPKTDLTSGKVEFVFNHALSRIGFKVKTSNEEYRINISQITLKANFNNSGTLNLNTGEWSGTTPRDRTYTLNTFTPANITSTAGKPISATEGYAMVIPTDLTSTKIQISVTYTYESKVSATQWSSAVEKTQSGSVGVYLEKGNAYTFVLTLDPGTAIVFDVHSVNNWSPNENGTDTPVTTTLVP